MVALLSARQLRLLRAIREYQEANAMPPTHRDLMEAADISSTSVISYNLRKLEDLGLIVQVHGRRGGSVVVAGSRYQVPPEEPADWRS